MNVLMRFLIPIVCIAAAGMDGQAAAATYYLSSAGEDEGDCSIEAPCASLSRATVLAVPGDSLVALMGSDEDAWLGQLLDISNQSTGRYRGLILHGFEGRQRRGFVRLATTWGTTLRPDFASAARAIPNLVRALNEQTGVSATVEKHVLIGSPEFFRSPFVYITADRAFEPTEVEVAAIGRYLREGGFIFADNAVAMLEFSQAEAVLRQLFVMALKRQGRLRRIRSSHAIYRSFYDFDGPPPGLDEALRTYDLGGVFLEGRLVALFADKGYVHSWAQSFGNEPQLRFGINAVVYAMSQPGSLAQQVHFSVQRRD